MKKPKPVYQEILEILNGLYGKIRKVGEYDNNLESIMLDDWMAIGVRINKIRQTYQNAAKKSSGPCKTTEKKARASRENLRKAALALTPEQRSERARKAVCARWEKAKKKKKS